MIRSIKNIFTVTALALSCIPALRCEDTQQQVLSKDTLKQDIIQIPRMYNPEACAPSFKRYYDRFMQVEMTTQEKTNIRQELITTAQEIKEQLQQRIDTLDKGNNKVDKRKLAKGVGGIAGSLILLAILNHNFNPFPYEILSSETMMVGGTLIANIGWLGLSVGNCRNSFDPNRSKKAHIKKCCNALDEIITHIKTQSPLK